MSGRVGVVPDHHPPVLAGDTTLGFESDENPENFAARLADAGFPDAVVIDENFGHSLRVTGPDGTKVQINFSDRSLYT